MRCLLLLELQTKEMSSRKDGLIYFFTNTLFKHTNNIYVNNTILYIPKALILVEQVKASERATRSWRLENWPGHWWCARLSETTCRPSIDSRRLYTPIHYSLSSSLLVLSSIFARSTASSLPSSTTRSDSGASRTLAPVPSGASRRRSMDEQPLPNLFRLLLGTSGLPSAVLFPLLPTPPAHISLVWSHASRCDLLRR